MEPEQIADLEALRRIINRLVEMGNPVASVAERACRPDEETPTTDTMNRHVTGWRNAVRDAQENMGRSGHNDGDADA